MSSTTAIVVAIVVSANILACLWLIWWTAKKQPDEETEGEVKSHTWDGDLQELNNPMPRWWLNMFVLTIVFAFIYLALFPGLGITRGTLGWSSAEQHDERLAVVEAKRAAHFAQFADRDVTELAESGLAIQAAGRLFADNCAGCHGPQAQGAVGFPNLSDGDWLYGNEPAQLLVSIRNGRNGFMPAQKAILAPEKVDDLVALVADWPDGGLPAERAAAAKATFMQSCAMCHGPGATGNIYMGAPNLTDDTWLYGGDTETIKHSILEGRHGKMPAHASLLSDTETKLLAAYLYWLSRDAS